MDYALIWACLIAVAIFAYVVLDGFDLGVGILFPTTKSESERDLMMNSIAPVWDGNETWLVLGGGGLFAVFPLAYATLMPAVYAPIIAMLVGLVFRGVAFEFRFKALPAHKWLWDISFFVGSFIAAFSQGVILGALVPGVEIAGRQYAGGWFDWLTPFSLMSGAGLVCGYALIGSTWLTMKLEGTPQLHFRVISRALLPSLLGFFLLVGLWMPRVSEGFLDLWLYSDLKYVGLFVPVLVLAVSLLAWHGLKRGPDYLPFVCVLILFLISYLGLAASLYPYIVPGHFTIWEAAAPDNSLKFLLVGAVVLIPMILAYTGYAYWVFRGKVEKDGGYHE
ncbi:cytochrome d ubiquinol oxidase subunit II [Polycladidibacter hongkongensis]|uniref:cytochrome d ubiquinol oxidase subunit II n=1 Tax=Polycladidibacter hongkongensis TaxID=1647556 RepID=UPI00083753F1|nr:cytochrome d ubiquinol oxidase subunit II [Pseudovibrio hongkongensis]